MSRTGEAAGHAHPPHLQHHFEDSAQQFDSGKLGMWLFLATEILLFGGLFCAYAIYRANHPEIFIYAHTFLDKNLGATNTVILLCSSLTMAWGVRAAQLGQKRLLCILLGLTILGGFGFLGIKYVEYKAKWEHGLLWARSYHPAAHEEEGHGEGGHGGSHAAGDAQPVDLGAPIALGLPPENPSPGDERTNLPAAGHGPAGLAPAAEAGAGHSMAEPANAQIFFSIYFLMTGLHGLHVVIGMIAIGWVLLKSIGGAFSPEYFTPVDLVGLYWHLVDLIWIFLFPLLYLIH